LGISVVICTKNEEKNIKRCLEAVQSVADEIIIVDSKSTDQTAAICKTYPKVKFFEIDWKGFSQTKNEANNLANQEFILSLDADEELSLECQQSILKIKPNLKGAYAINRMTNYCGQWIKHSGWYPDRHIRLFPKLNSKWVGEIHEQLQFDSNLFVKNIEGNVHHYSYYSIEEHWSRINSYSTVAANKYVNYNSVRIFLSMMINSKIRFIKHFIFKLGFLDGFAGLNIAILSACAVYLKYAKAYQLKKRKS
jgi:glycosyltransferase involved in cell wall biosynthesis